MIFSKEGPLKIHWSVTNACSFKCEFCCHFNDNLGILSTEDSYLVIDKIADAGAKILVMTGGDPFLRKDVLELISYAHEKGLIVVVDTNGTQLDKPFIEKLNGILDWIGLPLDGSTAKMHTAMRGSKENFYQIIHALEMLQHTDIKVKINTMVSRLNFSDIIKIGDVLQDFPIALWSLYQFWPLEKGKENRDKFEVRGKEFLNLCDRIREKWTSIPIEPVPFKKREYSYFFISSSGIIYNTPGDNGMDYKKLGHVLVNDFNEILDKHLIKTCHQKNRLSTQMQLGRIKSQVPL